MKNLFIIIILNLLLLSCTKKENTFDIIDFTFGGTFTEIYSIRLTQSDTVYIHQRWFGRRYNDSSFIPKEKTNYYGILDKQEKLKLFGYISKVNLFKYKSEYIEDYVDGSSYIISINKDFKNKIIFVHSHNAPKEIDSIAALIDKVKHNLKLYETKKQIEFTASGLVSPIPPPPPLPIKRH
jgi:hypothetical protein